MLTNYLKNFKLKLRLCCYRDKTLPSVHTEFLYRFDQTHYAFLQKRSSFSAKSVNKLLLRYIPVPQSLFHRASFCLKTTAFHYRIGLGVLQSSVWLRQARETV